MTMRTFQERMEEVYKHFAPSKPHPDIHPDGKLRMSIEFEQPELEKLFRQSNRQFVIEIACLQEINEFLLSKIASLLDQRAYEEVEKNIQKIRRRRAH